MNDVYRRWRLALLVVWALLGLLVVLFAGFLVYRRF